MAQHFHQPSDPAPGSPSGRVCPVCAKPTVWRCGRYGDFHGCPGFPACPGKIGRPRGAGAAAAAAAKSQGATAPTVPPEPSAGPSTVELSEDASEAVPVEPGSLEGAIAAVFRPLLDDAVRRATAAARAAAFEELAKRPGSTPLEIHVNTDPPVITKIEHAHVSLSHLLKKVSQGFKNLFIVGPAGSGKTTLARDLARALGRPCSVLSLSGGISESRLEGRVTPNLATGVEHYHDTASVRAYRDGGVILWDEIDASDPNMLIVTNAAVGNGHWTLPDGSVIERHPNCIIICAANTYGTGANRMYVGRNQLDAATLDRFVGAKIEVGYDRKLEERILPDAVALARIWTIREKLESLKIQKLCGTRTVIAVAQMLAGGETLGTAIAECMIGWSADEIAKVGEAA